MKVLGIDLGEHRIGLAISDPLGIVARPLDTWDGRDKSGLIGRICNLVNKEKIETVVVGIPYRTDGKESQKVEDYKAIVYKLRDRLSIPVEMENEMFTTVEAHEILRSKGVKERDRRNCIDKTAAAVILQGWLESH